jgi:hypothetical protein
MILATWVASVWKEAPTTRALSRTRMAYRRSSARARSQAGSSARIATRPDPTIVRRSAVMASLLSLRSFATSHPLAKGSIAIMDTRDGASSTRTRVTLTVRVLPPPARSPWTAWRREVKRVRGGAISRGRRGVGGLGIWEWGFDFRRRGALL